MLLRVKIHPGILLGDGLLCYSHPTAATCGGGGLDEYQRRARDRRPRADRDKPARQRWGGGPRRRALANRSNIRCWLSLPGDVKLRHDGFKNLENRLCRSPRKKSSLRRFELSPQLN